MIELHLAVVPIGRVDREELAAAVTRAARVLRQPLELRGSLPVPHESEDTERGQHRAATLLGRLRQEVLKLKPGDMLGADEAAAATPLQADGFIFVTDVDLFTANSEGALAALITAKQSAVVSVRRLREAFYNRRANPTKQRTRVVKELLRMAGRLRGLTECSDSDCVMGRSASVRDVDFKEERYCRACELRLFEGTIRI